MTLAERYHWTPAQIGAMDPDYLVELTAYIAALTDAQRTKE